MNRTDHEGRANHSYATFKNSRGETVYAGSAEIEGFGLDFHTPQNAYESYFEDFVVPQTIFGDSSTYLVSGSNDFPGFSHKTYFPDIMEVTSPDISGDGFLSISKDVQLTWNTDPQYTGSVVIGLWYNGTLSNRVDNTLPSETKLKYIEVPDNGSYTIPASELSDFPVGGYGTIYVARGFWDDKIVSSGSTEYEVILSGIAYATGYVTFDE